MVKGDLDLLSFVGLEWWEVLNSHFQIKDDLAGVGHVVAVGFAKHNGSLQQLAELLSFHVPLDYFTFSF